MRTLIVDDHNLVRAGIRRMLETMSSHLEVVGESGNGREALHMIPELKVDLLITDLSMPDMEGSNLIRQAKKRAPDIRCVVLSMHTGQDRVVAAIKAGANGYVHKNASAEELLDAVKAVANGKTYLHPSIAGSVVDLLRDSEDSGDPLDQLTARQREILKLIAEGRTTREIADQLSVSAKTVETHRSQLMERLNIRNVPGLVKIAIRSGLVDIEST
ncbi:MAG: response regulator [Woeseiaceae bacterium]